VRKKEQRRASYLVEVPCLREVDRDTHVVADDPVVGEVLVDNLAHLCLVVLEHVGGKVEHDVEHRGLVGEGSRAVVGVGVRRHLVVDVVGAKSADAHADKRLWQRDADGQEAVGHRAKTTKSLPLKVFVGVVGRLLDDARTEARGAAELAHVVQVGAGRRVGLVAAVGDEHALTDHAVDLGVEREQHHTVQEQRLSQELLAVCRCKDRLEASRPKKKKKNTLSFVDKESVPRASAG